jgi:hypothetical protein
MPLLIGDKKVTRISGPVSMHILCPKRDSEYIKLFPKAPILILFGDYHFSDEAYCKINEADKDTLIHYHIYNTEFLKLFSEKVGEDNIIDLYLEGGSKTHDFSKENEPMTRDTSGGKGPMHELWLLFRKCYRNTRMKREPVEESGCDVIKNIRWQSSDIRGYGQFKAYFIVQFNFDIIMQSYRGDQRVQEIKKILVNRDFKEYAECLLLTQEEFIKKYLHDDKSLIAKQLNKIKNTKQKDYLITMFEDYIKAEYKKTDPEQLKEFTLLNKAMIRMSNYDLSEEYDKAYEYVNAFMSGGGSFGLYLEFNKNLFTLLPDLYLLARSHKYMAKTKEDESKEEIKYPLVNIVYYGDYHVNNLVTCLRKIYDTVSIKAKDPTSPVLRCLLPMGNLTLDKYIADLNEFRSTQSS